MGMTSASNDARSAKRWKAMLPSPITKTSPMSRKWSALRISFGRRNNSRSATSAASKKAALLAALNGSAKSASLLPRSQ